MAPIIEDNPHPYPHLITLLQTHLPHSLPVLRRLQFTTFPGGSTPDAHILYAHSPGPTLSSNDTPPPHFAVAYVDISKAPETESWLYSSLEAFLPSSSASDRNVCVEQVLALLMRMQDIEAAQKGRYAERRGRVMVGSMHDGVLELLLARGVRTSYRNLHDVWLFRVEDLPEIAGEGNGGKGVLDGEMRWDVARREDAALIQARTHLPKAE